MMERNKQTACQYLYLCFSTVRTVLLLTLRDSYPGIIRVSILAHFLKQGFLN